jgi:hypothetical protein
MHPERRSGVIRPTKWARVSRLVTALALLGLGVLPSTAAASPSKFIYETCDSALPGGNSPKARFVVNPGVPMTPFDTCAQPGGAIGITETGPTAATFAFWDIEVPSTPGGFVETITLTAASWALGPGNDHTFVYEQGWPAGNGSWSQRIFHVADAPGELFLAPGFAIFMNCNGNFAPGCGAGPSVAAHYIAATEVDVRPPTLTAAQGTLFEAGVLRGRRSLGVEAADQGGGLSQLEVLVNELPAGKPSVANCNLAQVDNESYEGTVALSETPCQAKLKGSWTLDTAAYPFHDGANVVQVCATDFSTLSEPNETCSVPRTVTINNSCTESPIPGGEVLTAQFSATHRDAITVAYGRTAKVTGELSNRAGDTISGATVCVQAQTQGSRRGPHPVAVATTDAHGHFTYKLPSGPNRKVLLGYRHDTFQVADALSYYAHAKPTIHISPTTVHPGGVIHIRGRLPGKRAGGRVLVLQASALHSPHWYTFDRATTNRDGIYHSLYPLDETTTTTTYRIRAVVPRQREWPWEVGASAPAEVLVDAG